MPLSRRTFLASSSVLLSTLALGGPDANALIVVIPTKFRVYFGTYTSKESKGIYTSVLDLKTGALTPPELAAELRNPSFLAVHPSGKSLYAAGEIGDFQGGKGGAISAFSLDAATGKLVLLNQKSTVGSGPCHVSVDPEGKVVLAANYGGGSVIALKINADGSVADVAEGGFVQHKGSSVNKSRQEAPHAHSINPDRAGQFAFAADLGLDKILIYKIDPAAGILTANDPAFAATPAGGGPRHFAFHPAGKYAYVCNEMTSSVTAFTYDATKGALTELHTISTLPEPVKGNSTAEIQVHPSGKFVYCSNRGHDSLAIFTVDKATGKLTAAGHQKTGGKTPRNFGIDPSGQFILAANQNTHDVFVFRIDPNTGQLTQVGEPVKVGSPVCVKFASMS